LPVEYSFDKLKNTILNQPTPQPKNTMTRIQDYVVITSSKGFESLEALIKDNIRNGWQPLGGVAIANFSSTDANGLVNNTTTFAQAMVLYE